MIVRKRHDRKNRKIKDKVHSGIDKDMGTQHEQKNEYTDNNLLN